MKGELWIERFSKLPTHRLYELRRALLTLQKDPDIEREFSGLGLFDGFPSLLGIIENQIRDKEKALETKE